MKILLTGAAGQVGQALCNSVPAGMELTALSRAELDLADGGQIDSVIKAHRPDWLINAAAYTAVDKAESEPDLARAINADAAAAMVMALAQTGGRIAHLSTDFVFDGEAERAYQPGDTKRPLSVYGHTKSDGEDHLRAEDLLVRTSWVYGAGGANFVTTMLRLMRERDELGIVSDQIGAPTWASSLADTIWALVQSDASGTYHHCDDGSASWHDFAVAIAEEAKDIGLLEKIPAIKPITAAEYPTPATRPKFSLLDCSETRNRLGVKAEHWRDNLRAMLKEEKALG